MTDSLLEPVEGISLERYAALQALQDSPRWHEILAGQGLDPTAWKRIDAEWQYRLSGQAADAQATMALLFELGRCFARAKTDDGH